MKNILIYGGTSLISIELIKILDTSTNKFFIFCRNKDLFVNQIKQLNFDESKFNIFQTELENLKDNLNNIEAIDNINGIYWIAGYTGDPTTEIKDPENCKKNIEINFLNPIIIINKLIEKMLLDGSSYIAVITSVAGLRGRSKNIFYGSAKSALISYLSGIRQRFNGKINVTTVIPGYIRTAKFNLSAPKILISEPDKLARKIVDAVNNKREIIYCSFQWKLIMNLIKLIPEKIFKKLSF